jgi:hypothetical protein
MLFELRSRKTSVSLNSLYFTHNIYIVLEVNKIPSLQMGTWGDNSGHGEQQAYLYYAI